MRTTSMGALMLTLLMLSACTHSIAVNTRPPGATAQLTEVGGNKAHQLGQTPVKAKVAGTGEYMLIITRQGFAPFKKKIELGTQNTYDIDLTPVYEFTIDTEPEGATVVLENKGTGVKYGIGKSPAKYMLEGKGPFSITASMQGYETGTADIATTEGVIDVYKSIVLKKLQ
jgi:PEGA domain